ncbi:methyl-accepting chemotaxis protein [Bradyrhizobium sp.]|uniref:methyl-accepting chemotaxis protein n=1 Tax=Bradyrhizobium sp. TaxID=376 RepID=UPI0025BFED57|nr:PAS domain-containing methyl-accepting chemotaxis protein [Bradyrhizobium sp.]MBV8919945.1 PAS domain-containing methyl-accepting chemotaxis protein [Bradyrhizobium sp.]
MSFWRISSKTSEALALAESIYKSQAVIEFNMDGTVITANQTLLDVLGYRLSEITGRHHGDFVSAAMRASADYRTFWADLNKGKTRTGVYSWVGKNGKEVWLRAAFTPLADAGGRLVKVVEFGSDVTAQRIQSMEDAGKLAAIARSQAVIDLDLDGTIVGANEALLQGMGYSLAEIVGKHHSMFVAPAERDSAAYREFWAALNRGEFRIGEFKRIGKDGREAWVLASYNPILDDSGKPFRVVVFASDITRQKLRTADLAGQIEAIGKSQAVIEFDMDGVILGANENFQKALGYTLSEIKGRHHSMFVPATDRDGAAYREFWARLKRGEFQSGEYKRIGKAGKEIWIQASYNPIRDVNGQPCKVVKYANDTTAQVIARMKGDKVRGMMEQVASGAEQLSSSVREISEAMTKSRQTAATAVERVEVADRQAQRLSTAAGSMSSIVELIGDITGQINLLALNATIESARAGDAGRGFAVVAAEVKNLANQAKQATDKIGSEIGNLTGISADVVGALNAIKTAIQGVREYVSSTAVAVEEQSTVTNEMSSSMRRAAAEAASIGRAG